MGMAAATMTRTADTTHMTRPETPENGGLLPHYRHALERVRVQDLALSYRAMAEALNTTAWADRLVRSSRRNGNAPVDHTTVRNIEKAQAGWPSNPDAWIGAYAELAGVPAVTLWRRAVKAWADDLASPEAAGQAENRIRAARRSARNDH